jgi:hypothetical protein
LVGEVTVAPREFDYGRSARIFPWYGLAEHDRFACNCGWIGVFREMSNEWFEELIDGSCPRCGTMLAIRTLPTIDEAREAAALGNPEAAKELASIEAQKRRATSP